MDIKAARRVSERTQKSVYDRLRGGPVNSVCSFWLAGRCTKSPCRFLHPEPPPSQPPNPSQYRHSKAWQRGPNNTVKNSSISPSERAGPEHESTKKAHKKVCSYWISGNCVHGEKCKHLHSWFSGNGFSLLAKLEGHNKAVTGIALPSGSDKLTLVVRTKLCGFGTAIVVRHGTPRLSPTSLLMDQLGKFMPWP